MRNLLVGLSLAVAVPASAADPNPAKLEKFFDTKNVRVVWKAAPAVDAGATLVVGDGNAHGGWLQWYRFQPANDRVDVLFVDLDEGWHPFRSKFPPDRAPVTVKSARMTSQAYATLIADISAVAAAIVEKRNPEATGFSSNNFWVSARLAQGDKVLVGLDWAGYDSPREAELIAKPNAAVTLARDATAKLKFRPHELTAEERTWASAKFVADRKTYINSKSHWWVLDYSIVTVGVVGDATALPALRDIIQANKLEYDVYAAINAVTRITKKDVRGKPVEEMDLDTVRPKVLELLRDVK
ncbi:MAG: hypothetical protein ACRC7O_13785 [Fimbriiglobus sp.]